MTHTLTTVTPVEVSVFHHPQFDALDAELINERLIRRASYHRGPQVGDWVRLHGDTRVYPLADVGDGKWGAKGKIGDPEGFYYFETSGLLSYDGRLHGSIPLDLLRETEDTETTAAYIFHHDQWKRDNEVNFLVPLRVWQAPRLRYAPKLPAR